jgi:hypothetical protein
VARPKVDKIWADAIRRAVLRVDKQKRKHINILADRLVQAGIKGDISALREIGDRLDGRAHQSIGGDGKAGEITIRIVE